MKMLFANIEKRQYYHQLLPPSTYQESSARSNLGILVVNTALQIENTILGSWWKTSCCYFRKNLSYKIDKVNIKGLFLHLVYSDSGTEIKIEVSIVEFPSTRLKLRTEILIEKIPLVIFQKIHLDKREKFVLLFGIFALKVLFQFFLKYSFENVRFIVIIINMIVIIMLFRKNDSFGFFRMLILKSAQSFLPKSFETKKNFKKENETTWCFQSNFSRRSWWKWEICSKTRLFMEIEPRGFVQWPNTSDWVSLYLTTKLWRQTVKTMIASEMVLLRK